MELKNKKKNTAVKPLPDKCGPKELAYIYASHYDCSLKEAEEAIRNTVDVICEALCSGHSVSFIGNFNLEVKNRAERKGRNPKTKEEITIPASKVVSFKAGAKLKKGVNN